MKRLDKPAKLPDDRSRAEYAYDHLMTQLRTGELRPGQRLQEVKLSQSLDISRTPVRDALRRMASEGLAEMVAGRGLTVAEFDQQQVRELFALRALLEGGAARLAAQFASAADIVRMAELLNRKVAVKGPLARMMDSDTSLHRAIHDASRNRYMAQALEQMWGAITLLPGSTLTVPGRADAAHEEHLAILAALEQRNGEKAEFLARHHIDMALAARIRMMSTPRKPR
jgi:DNA-binding GntR family transcriptional regulator